MYLNHLKTKMICILVFFNYHTCLFVMFQFHFILMMCHSHLLIPINPQQSLTNYTYDHQSAMSRKDHVISYQYSYRNRLENRKWEAGCIQEASICRLESANALERLDWAQAVRHMRAIERSDAAVRCGRHS